MSANVWPRMRMPIRLSGSALDSALSSSSMRPLQPTRLLNCWPTRRAIYHYVSPAIAARYNTTYEAKDWGITTDVAEMIGNKRELEEGIKVMCKMHKAGIRILPFGDYGFAWLPHGTESRDLAHFVNLFGFHARGRL